MKYNNTVHGRFIDRPNRFIAHVDVDGKTETVHVKNTGRCRELLVPGAEVVLEKADNPARSTGYDLVMVHKPSVGWVNIDSQAPNKIAYEWLKTRGYDLIRPEYRYGSSRIDFYLEKGDTHFLCEIKGCTLEIDGRGYFPDAPTVRGAKHLRELAGAVKCGYSCMLAYVIQMNGITSVSPYSVVDPDYAAALAEAEEAGVEIVYITCDVKEDEVIPRV